MFENLKWRLSMTLDAHCHTDCSDGSFSIEERIDLIQKCGFHAATITDHDFISEAQVKRAQDACGSMPFIPGIELTVSHYGHVVHILGYFVDPCDSNLQRHIARVQNLDQAYTSMLIKVFLPQGIEFGLNDLISPSIHTHYSLRFIKRLSFELFSYNKKLTIQAFQRALTMLGMHYADFSPWPVREAIDLIHGAGGCAVVAHPGGAGDRGMHELGFLLHNEHHIQQYIDWGIDGIETGSPVHSVQEKQFYSELAKRFNLLQTAGSDCHGDDPFAGPLKMGIYTDLPENLYERMLSYHQCQKCIA
jgi:predicted metal-dependent phosphoesterase TrpH